jgi:cyanate permease
MHCVRAGFGGLDDEVVVVGQVLEELVGVVRAVLRRSTGVRRRQSSDELLRCFAAAVLLGTGIAVIEMLLPCVGELGVPIPTAFGDFDQSRLCRA